MAHGINANIVHGWRKLAREAGAGTVSDQFVPVVVAPVVPPVVDERSIKVELRRRGRHGQAKLADECRHGAVGLDARVVTVIRADAVWTAVQPLDMRAGTESALARVAAGSAQSGRTTPTCSPTAGPTA